MICVHVCYNFGCMELGDFICSWLTFLNFMNLMRRQPWEFRRFLKTVATFTAPRPLAAIKSAINRRSVQVHLVYVQIFRKTFIIVDCTCSSIMLTVARCTVNMQPLQKGS
jgi:hypothetical protein